jgi:hypothetical protein
MVCPSLLTAHFSHLAHRFLTLTPFSSTGNRACANATTRTSSQCLPRSRSRSSYRWPPAGVFAVASPHRQFFSRGTACRARTRQHLFLAIQHPASERRDLRLSVAQAPAGRRHMKMTPVPTQQRAPARNPRLARARVLTTFRLGFPGFLLSREHSEQESATNSRLRIF